MPRMNFWRRSETDQERQAATSGDNSTSSSTIPIRDAERRRLQRLLVRKSSIEYDITQAETAFMPSNRWTERIEQLDDAIRQANEDLERLSPQPGSTPDVRLPDTLIEIDVRSVDVPAEIELRASKERFVFREELDWAERGHQVALPKLQQVAGSVDRLIPSSLDGDDRDRLSVHLTNSLSVIANTVLKNAANGEPPGSFTLADLTRPCEECGGWLDPLGRCPACAELDWQRNQIAAAASRLIDERNDAYADMERARERMPIFRRQLQDVETDIQELRNKGVEVE